MEETFRDFLDKKVLEIYLDDTIMHTNSLISHSFELTALLSRIKEKEIKCSFMSFR